jgi:hypothetical protein
MLNILLLASLMFHLFIQQDNSQTCLRTFSEFAYDLPEVVRPFLPDTLPFPWEKVSSPPEGSFTWVYPFSSISIVRDVEGSSQEIWVLEPENVIRVFHTGTETWEDINTNIENTTFNIDFVIKDKDEGVWGYISFQNQIREELLQLQSELPVLVKFNDLSRRFENDEVSLWVPNDFIAKVAVLKKISIPQILVDDAGRFWILTSDYKIYRYEPKTQTFDSIMSFNQSVNYIYYLGETDMLYIVESERYDPERFGYIGNVYRYDVTENTLILLNVPSDWPFFIGIEMDSDGNLWLGATGYQDAEGEWHLIHKDVDFYLSQAGSHQFATPPGLILIDSDDTLWFMKYVDNHFFEGTAWYRKELDEGCMIMNDARIILEDDHQILWTIHRDGLYRNVLSQE